MPPLHVNVLTTIEPRQLALHDGFFSAAFGAHMMPVKLPECVMPLPGSTGPPAR